MDSASTCSSIPIENLEEIIQDFKNPDYEESQKIRDEYGAIAEKIRMMSIENGEGGCSLDKLTEELASINEIALKKGKKHGVKTANEGTMDARIFKDITRLARANIEKTQTSVLTFNPSEYAKLIAKSSGTNKTLAKIFKGDFETINRMAKPLHRLYRTTYGLEPLYGAFEWEPPTKPAREAARKKDDLKGAIKKTVRQVETSSSYEENQMIEVLRIHKVLCRRVKENGCEPINFLEFVIDPKCFATTVQNIFHTSFLMRDKKAKFSFDEYKIPYISPVEGGKESSGAAETNHQSVVEMNLDIWKEAIDVLEIKEAMIPNISRSNKRPSQSSQF